LYPANREKHRRLFYRRATYRDTDHPPKPLDAERDQALHQVRSARSKWLMSIRRDALRVHGFLQSRDYRNRLTISRKGAQRWEHGSNHFAK
jgi:hypothetical protein